MIENTYDEAIRYLAKAETAIQEGNESQAGLYVQMADVLSRLSGVRPRPSRGPRFGPPMSPVGPDTDEGDRPRKAPRTMLEGLAASMSPPVADPEVTE